LFFVLSGFILTHTYAGYKIDKAGFWRARFARIYPLYLFSLLVCAQPFLYLLRSTNPFGGWFREHTALTIALAITLLQAWVPPAALAWNYVAWSLSVELFFYSLFPFLVPLVLRLPRRAIVAAAVGCWVVSLGFGLAYVAVNPDHVQLNATEAAENLFWLNFLKYHPIVRLPEFVLGMCCANLIGRYEGMRKWADHFLIAGACCYVLLLLGKALIPFPIFHTGLVAPAFALIITGLACKPSTGRGNRVWLQSKGLVLLGNASYATFLLHVPMMALFFWDGRLGARFRGPGWIVVFCVTLLLVSVLVYRLVEEPARRLLRGSPAKTTNNLSTSSTTG
jgi:peptidoglycan/LPS O-acetylase OafA/YrhL